jgi:serine/threonine-protein kinase
VKLLSPKGGDAPSNARRMVHEAQAAAELASEHVTRVLDIGELDSGEPDLVMELLEGVDFAGLLGDRGPLPVSDVARYLVQASDAIAEAHSRGIVHRDLKPSNLFLTKRRDGSDLVKLMDFGISKRITTDGEDGLTRTGDSLGTPHYMSPEQLLSARDVDTRSDIWALGVILYRMLTGEHAFTGESAPAVHIAIASAKPPDLCAARPDAPRELERLIHRCLVRSRDARLQTARGFATALLPFADADTQTRYAHLRSPETTSSGDAANEESVQTPPLVAPDGETHATWSANDVERAPRAARRSLLLALGATTIAAAISIYLLRPSPAPAHDDKREANAAALPAPATPMASSAPAEATAATAPAPTPSIMATPSPSLSAAQAASSSRSPAEREAPGKPARAIPSAARAPTPQRPDPYGQRR